MNANTSLPDWLRAYGGQILNGRLRESAEERMHYVFHDPGGWGW